MWVWIYGLKATNDPSLKEDSDLPCLCSLCLFVLNSGNWYFNCFWIHLLCCAVSNIAVTWMYLFHFSLFLLCYRLCYYTFVLHLHYSSLFTVLNRETITDVCSLFKSLQILLITSPGTCKIFHLALVKVVEKGRQEITIYYFNISLNSPFRRLYILGDALKCPMKEKLWSHLLFCLYLCTADRNKAVTVFNVFSSIK